MSHGSCPQIERKREEDQTVKTEPQSNFKFELIIMENVCLTSTAKPNFEFEPKI